MLSVSCMQAGWGEINHRFPSINDILHIDYRYVIVDFYGVEIIMANAYPVTLTLSEQNSPRTHESDLLIGALIAPC